MYKQPWDCCEGEQTNARSPTLRGVWGQGKEFFLAWEQSKHASRWECHSKKDGVAGSGRSKGPEEGRSILHPGGDQPLLWGEPGGTQEGRRWGGSVDLVVGG